MSNIVNIGTGPGTGDGDTIRSAFAKINAGFASVVTTSSIAASGILGITKPDGVTITVDVNGTLSVVPTAPAFDGGAARKSAALTDMDLVAVRKNLKIGIPVFRPESYGAKVDGVTDDSAAWTALMSDLRAVPGGGSIELPIGVTLCKPGIIAMPPFSSISGKGTASVIKWSGPNMSGTYLIDMSGTDSNPGSVVGYNTLRNFAISGGPAGGGSYLIRAYYNAHSIFSDIWASSANIGLMDLVQFWDARITNIQGEYIGTTETSNSIWIRNSAAASGFGSSSDTSNQVFITNVRFESFYGSALRIEKGPGNGNPPNGIFVKNFKAESGNFISQPAIYIGDGTNFSSFTDLYISINGRASGSATINGLENHSSGQNHFSRINVCQNASGVVGSPFFSSASGVDHVADVAFTSGPGTPSASNSVITVVSGTAQPIVSGYCQSYPDMPSIGGYGQSVSASRTLSSQDRYVRVSTSSGSVALTLPPAANCVGHDLFITKVTYDQNQVTITPAANEQISYLPMPLRISSLSGSYLLRPDPTGWTLIAQTGVANLGQSTIIADGSVTSSQVLVTGASDNNRQLRMGYDTSNDGGFVQSIHSGVAYTALTVQPLGGDTVFPSLVAASSDSDAASKGVGLHALYRNGNVVQIRLS